MRCEHVERLMRCEEDATDVIKTTGFTPSGMETTEWHYYCLVHYPSTEATLFDVQMSGQGDLYKPRENVRTSDPDTSHQAARTAALRATSNAAQLLINGYAHGPATHEEAANLAGLTHETGHKRTSDLKRRGLVVPAGYTRPGKSGSQMSVYEVTAEGREYIRGNR